MTRKTLLTLGLLAAFMLSACIPTAATPAPASNNGAEPATVSAEEDPAPAQEEAPVAAPALTEPSAEATPAAEEVVFVPTSRGSELAATDPGTINLASGEPQLIEFFAFW